MATNQTPGIGHNRPAAEGLEEALKERYGKLTQRGFDLGDALDRLKRIPIDSEVMVAKVANFIEQCRTLKAALENAFEEEKAEFRVLGQTVDRFFRDRRRPMEEAITTAEQLTKPFMAAKLAAERKAAAEEAAKLQAQLEAEAAEKKRQEEAAAAEAAAKAKAAAEEAARTKTEDANERARAAAEAAAEAKAQAELPIAPVTVEAPTDIRSRVRGTNNRVLAKTVWTWTWVEQGLAGFDLNSIRDFIHPEAVASAIDAAVRAGHRDFGPTVKVYEDTQVRV